jgi:putative ribosome biogenesis GTPase RsgA
MNRVWLYIISKELNEDQLNKFQLMGNDFVKSWTAHENQLTASFEIFNRRIIIVNVNENINAASGCSIDKLTRFIKLAEAEFSIELLNRMLVALKVNEGVQIVHASKIPELLKEEFITEKSIVYNTSAATENELQNWELPLNETWLKKYLN